MGFFYKRIKSEAYKIFLIILISIVFTPNFVFGINKISSRIFNKVIKDNELKSIWISVQDDESVLAACNLVSRLNQFDDNVPILITTKTIDSKNVADDIFEFCPNVFVMVLAGCDPLLISRYCHRFNPGCIIIIDKKISDPEHSVLLLVSYLKGIPNFLIDAEFEHGLEYQMIMNPHFFCPLFNAFKAIYVKQERDIVRFRGSGVVYPEIFCGDLDSFNVLEKKALFLRDNGITEDQIKKIFSDPILMINPASSSRLDICFDILDIIDNRNIPIKKIIIARENIVNHIDMFELELAMRGKSLFLLSERDSWFDDGFFNLKKLQEICDSYDVIVVPSKKDFFIFHAISSFYIIEGNIVNTKEHNFMEAAAWKNAIIVIDTNDVDFKNIDLSRPIIKEISFIKCQNYNDIANNIIHLIDDKFFYENLVDHSYQGLCKIYNITSKNLDYFFWQIIELCKHPKENNQFASRQKYCSTYWPKIDKRDFYHKGLHYSRRDLLANSVKKFGHRVRCAKKVFK